MTDCTILQYKHMVKRKLSSRNDIDYCPKCGKLSLFQKPTNHRKFVCQGCGTESIIICPRKR